MKKRMFCEWRGTLSAWKRYMQYLEEQKTLSKKHVEDEEKFQQELRHMQKDKQSSF